MCLLFDPRFVLLTCLLISSASTFEKVKRGLPDDRADGDSPISNQDVSKNAANGVDQLDKRPKSDMKETEVVESEYSKNEGAEKFRDLKKRDDAQAQRSEGDKRGKTKRALLITVIVLCFLIVVVGVIVCFLLLKEEEEEDAEYESTYGSRSGSGGSGAYGGYGEGGDGTGGDGSGQGGDGAGAGGGGGRRSGRRSGRKRGGSGSGAGAGEGGGSRMYGDSLMDQLNVSLLNAKPRQPQEQAK